MNDNSSSSIGPGSLVSGRYKIVSALGQGAMGDVYLCSHKDLGDKLFVLKILKPEISNDETIMKRFHNEVIAALNVSHENVVRAYEFIKEGNLVGYTMEYVKGGDLADKMMINAQLPIETCIDYLFQMCAGTAALHKHGIIHRDLKPENILITEDGIVKISDFGISMMDKNSRMTETGALLGSTNYIAPEYIQFQKVDDRTDIYALGIIAYEMVTGSDPFPGENIFIKMQQRTQVNPYDPRMYRNDCPESLALWISKAITISPKDRFQTCLEMIEALNEVEADQPATFSPNKTYLDSKPRDTYELKGTVSESQGTTQKKAFAQNYHSEVIDLTNKGSYRQTHSPYVTTTIAKKTKKNPLQKLLYIVPVALVLILGFLLYQKYTKQKEIAAAIALAQQQYVPPAKMLPDYVKFEKEYKGVMIDAEIAIASGRLASINFTATLPKIPGELTSLDKITLNRVVISQVNGLNFNVLADATADILLNDKLITQKTSIRILGKKSADNNKMILNFSIPDKLDVSVNPEHFGFQTINGELVPFLHGEITITAEEIEAAALNNNMTAEEFLNDFE